jgi:hypothetical protein
VRGNTDDRNQLRPSPTDHPPLTLPCPSSHPQNFAREAQFDPDAKSLILSKEQMVAHTDWDAAADEIRSKASKKSKDSASTAKSRNKRHMASLKKKAERKHWSDDVQMRDFSTSSVASYGGGSSITADSGSVGSGSGMGEAGELLQNIARAMSVHSGGSRSRTTSAASGGTRSRAA